MKPSGKGILPYVGFAALACLGVLLFRATSTPLYRFSEQTFWKPLVHRLSPDFKVVSGRLDEISEEFKNLPDFLPPVGGGTTGYLSDPEVDKKIPAWVEFTFPESRVIDAVACVPAQQPRNVYSNEALSLAARMEVVFELDGREVRRFPFETEADVRGLRATLPFFSDFDPMEVDTVRIEDVQAPGGTRDFAIGEFFIFSGNESVGHEAEIVASSSRRGIPGVDIDYIRDEQTSLGLPEIEEPHRYVGYRSQPKAVAEFAITIRLDWEERQRIDEVRLYPVGRHLGVATNAAGFPPEVEVEFWSGEQEEWVELTKKSGEEMESPGWNPVALRFPTVETERIRLVFPKLWKATKRSSAILALAEIEPRFRGVPLVGATLSVSNPPQDGAAAAGADGKDRFWGLLALIDGMTTDGRIIAERIWLQALAQRAELLIEQVSLRKRIETLGTGLDRGLSRAVLVSLLLFFAVILWQIIRQQRNHRREMRDVRNQLAADLHDDLGSNLSTISIYAQRLRRQLDSPPECIDPMQRLIRESLGSLKEMVSFTTPQISRPVSLVERLREIAEIHCAETLHDFTVAPGLEGVSVSSAHRRSLRLFLKEAIHNAMRHSGADQIGFHIRRDENRKIWFSIRDNGKGLPPEVLEKTSSLPTLRLRAEEMDAIFRVCNPPGGGCEVAVSIRPV